MTTSIKDDKCFFWTIDLGDHTAFLIGSIHLLPEDMHPLPDKFENAFLNSSTIVLEANIDEVKTPQLKQYVQSVGFYPPGETIWQNISKKTKKELEKKLKDMQFPLNVAEKIRPWLLPNMLNVASEGAEAKYKHVLGIDAHFFEKAKQDGKKLMFLESAKDQVDHTAKLPPNQQELLLKDALQTEVEKGEIPFEDVIELWKNGEADTLEFHYRKHHKRQMKIYQRIVIDRTQRWLTKIEELFQRGENVMIIVGGGHMGGSHGLVRLLTDKGYDVVQE